jgi:tRNA(Ile)-lysidine synthase
VIRRPGSPGSERPLPSLVEPRPVPKLSADPADSADPAGPAGPGQPPAQEVPEEDDPVIGPLLERCTFPPVSSALVCAVSGGPDSLALLALAVEAGCEVTAVHVDHGLRPGSEAEAGVVADVARTLGAAFRAERGTVEPGPNLEARARAARREVLGPDAATGHTADDQAETVLINLLRGAGVDGLSAMRAGPTHPILALRRSETAGLCRHLGIRPVRDPSNVDPRYQRNRVRHELLPLCCAIAGRDVVPVLARQANLLAGDAAVLAALAELVDAGDGRVVGAAPDPVARRAVRRWLTGDDSYPPDAAAVDRVLEVARGTRRAAEVAKGRRVSRSAGRLSVDRSGGDGSPSRD